MASTGTGVLERMLDAAVVVDDDLRVLFLNAAAARVCRTEPGRARLRPLFSLLPPLGQLSFAAQCRGARERGAERTLYDVDVGDLRRFDLRIAPLPYGVLVVLTDASGRPRHDPICDRLLHTALGEAAEFRELVEAAPDAFLTVTGEGRIALVNAQAETLFGYRRDELIGQPIELLVPAARREAHQGFRERYVTTPRTRPMGMHRELHGRRRDGTEFPVEISLSAIGHDDDLHVAAIVRDGTPRRQAEETRHRHAEEFMVLVEGAPDVIARYDRDGRYLYVNPAIERATGRPREQWVGRTSEELGMPAALVRQWEEAIARVFESGEPATLEFDFPTVDGARRYFSRLAPERARDGCVESVLVISSEITERRRAEEELQASQRRLERLVETMAEALLLVDPDGGITFANASAERLLGLGRRELASRRVGDQRWALRWRDGTSLFGADGLALRAIRSGVPLSGLELDLTDVSGRVRAVRLSAVPLREADDRAAGAIVTFLDVTEQRRSEREVQLLQSLPAAMGEAADWREALAVVLRRVCEVTGWTVGAGWIPNEQGDRLVPATHWHAPDAAAEVRTFARTVGTRSYALGEGMAGRAGAARAPLWVRDLRAAEELPCAEPARQYGLGSAVAFPVKINGTLIAVLVFYATEARDEDARFVRLVDSVLAQLAAIVRQQLALAELRRSEASLAEAQRIARLGNWEWVVATGVLRWSDEIYRVFGVTRERFTPTYPSFLEAVHPADRVAVQRAVAAALSGERPYSIEHRIVLPDGGERIVHEQGEVERDAQGAPVRVVGTVQDVTEPRRLEEQLLQARKLEGLGRLAGGVAHDFNNMLTAIRGFAELALGDLPAESPAREDVREILHAADRAAALTGQLLAFGRRQQLEPRLLDLSATVTEAEELLLRIVGPTVAIRPALQPALPAVLADPGQMHQVLINLVANARDAMPEGGTVTIRVGRASVQAADHRRADVAGSAAPPPGEYVELVVEDSGVGIDAHAQARLFEPFFTTKAPGKGTGLGLATVYGIVTQSGGYVDVRSTPGAGAAFRILLPACGEAPPAPSPDELAGVRGGHETVLLVDDEAPVREVARRVLEQLGYRVLVAEHGLDALRHMTEQPAAVHLLATDLAMPGMGGRLLAERLLADHPSMRVLYLSGFVEDATLSALLESGRAEFLQKPFAAATLASRVRALLDRPLLDRPLPA